MISYLDSSVVLRKMLGDSLPLAEFDQLDGVVTSQLTRLECLRTLDRARLRNLLSDEEFVERRNWFFELLKRTEVVELSPEVLSLAESSFGVVLGTVDSIHLVTAMLWMKKSGNLITLLTHDRELGLAAIAQNMKVKGI